MVTPAVVDDGTVVFGLDDASIADLQPLIGPWPYRRDVWAHVVDYLRVQGARHVTLDVLLAEPRDGDDQLREALARTPGIVLAAVPVPFRVTTDRSAPRAATSGLSVAEGTPASEAIDLRGTATGASGGGPSGRGDGRARTRTASFGACPC